MDVSLDYGRDSFEKWVSSRSWYKKVNGSLNKTADGMYCHYNVNDRWLAWREAWCACELNGMLKVGDKP